MTKDEFRELKQGCLVQHKRSKSVYIITDKINENVYQMGNCKFLFMTDYINTNTCEDYDVVKEVKE